MAPLSRFSALAQMVLLTLALSSASLLQAQTPKALDAGPTLVTPEILEKAKAQFGAEEVLKTLAEIADANEANGDKFPHAVGQFEIIDLSGPQAQWPKKPHPGTVDFWYAASGQKFRCRFNYDAKDARSRVNVESIVTPEHFISFRPNWNIRQSKEFPAIEGFEEHSGPMATLRRSSDARGEKWSAALNAASLLYLSQQQPPEAYCRIAAQFHKGKKEDWQAAPKCYVEIQTEGAHRITKLFLLNPGPPGAKGPSNDCIVFDSDAGNLPVRYTMFRNGQMDIDEQWAYETHNGGFFPSEHRHTTYRNGEVSHERRLKTTSIEFTEPKETDFAIDRLNFQYGDRLDNKLEKRLLIWDGINFVSAEGFKFDKTKAARK